jgi:hypothetical protein
MQGVSQSNFDAGYAYAERRRVRLKRGVVGWRMRVVSPSWLFVDSAHLERLPAFFQKIVGN